MKEKGGQAEEALIPVLERGGPRAVLEKGRVSLGSPGLNSPRLRT